MARVCASLASVVCTFALLAVVTPPLTAQTAAFEDYKTERAKALELTKDHQELEALPLLEDLAKKNPDDATVLADLGIALVSHASTLADEPMANQERVRARAVLTRAKQLGSNSPLMLNLLDLLPANGAVGHAANSEVDAAFQAGERAFAKHDFAEAIKNYSRAAELDPKNYWAVMDIGDSYFSLKDFALAREWYERAIAVEPDIETAYRYEADMLTKNGEMELARTRSIQAVIADPYHAVPWRGLQGWAHANKLELRQVHINTHSDVGADGNSKVTITLDPSALSGAGAVWILYSGARANWRNAKFKQAFPKETEYRHSLAEELDALTTAADGLPKNSTPDAKQPADADLQLLGKLANARMLEPYILLSAPDQGITRDYPAYRAAHRAQLEEYLSRFVVPPAPATPSPAANSAASATAAVPAKP